MQNELVSAIMNTWPGASMSVLKEPTEVEINGMVAGGNAGGVYLDSIGKSDISELTYDQWMFFVETIIRGYELYCTKIWEHEIPGR